ncbi:MAG: hypothetical protein VX677_07570 [Candidatus Poribacteria bacterium]|nr:hypothetical protein [Candidatus Poribacteria bacterium]|tara:strand:+ start:705 stop:1316 length:612 start_codon:yes stop_codon:yes gene_type:complete
MKSFVQKVVFLFSILVLLAGSSCSMFESVKIIPVFDPEATILPQTNTIAYIKNGITAMSLPLSDVKAVDAFAVLIYNGTDHFISLRQKDCWLLDGTGKETKPLDKSMYTARLGRNFKPKLPPEFPSEVFRWNKTLRIQGDPAPLPTTDIERTNIMPKNQSKFFLYFPIRSIKSSSLRVIVPKIYSEYDQTETTFVFKFRVKKG